MRLARISTPGCIRGNGNVALTGWRCWPVKGISKREDVLWIPKVERGVLLAIGGTPDHVHLLIRLKPAIFIPDLLRSIKAGSSRWVNKRSRFAWQEGYGAFSVSESSAKTVHRYIQNQEQNHQTWSFEEEWIGLLDRHGIEFDPAKPFG